MTRTDWSQNPKVQEQLAKRGIDVPEAKELDIPVKKYRNQPTADSTGRVCDSKLEARVGDRLRADAYEVIPQVSIPLSSRPRDRMVLDFLIIEDIGVNGRFTGYFADAKGMATKDWIQKARRFEDKYGLGIEVIKK